MGFLGFLSCGFQFGSGVFFSFGIIAGQYANVTVANGAEFHRFAKMIAAACRAADIDRPFDHRAVIDKGFMVNFHIFRND